MDNKNNKIKLDGKTAQEQAAQFVSLLKDKKLSVEELTQLIPLNADFVKELTNIIEKETDAGKERYASSMEVIKAIYKDNNKGKEKIDIRRKKNRHRFDERYSHNYARY